MVGAKSCVRGAVGTGPASVKVKRSRHQKSRGDTPSPCMWVIARDGSVYTSDGEEEDTCEYPPCDLGALAEKESLCTDMAMGDLQQEPKQHLQEVDKKEQDGVVSWQDEREESHSLHQEPTPEETEQIHDRGMCDSVFVVSDVPPPAAADVSDLEEGEIVDERLEVQSLVVTSKQQLDENGDLSLPDNIKKEIQQAITDGVKTALGHTLPASVLLACTDNIVYTREEHFTFTAPFVLGDEETQLNSYMSMTDTAIQDIRRRIVRMHIATEQVEKRAASVRKEGLQRYRVSYSLTYEWMPFTYKNGDVCNVKAVCGYRKAE